MTSASRGDIANIATAFGRGEVSWTAFEVFGVEIQLEPAKVEVQVPPGTPVVEVLARDVAVGFLRRWALGTELDKWAATLLGAGVIDFVDLEDQPEGDALLEGLWAASAREPISEDAIASARASAESSGSLPG